MSTQADPEEEERTPFRRINGKLCVTGAGLCEILGVSRQAIGQWTSRGCPKEARGWYCLHDVLAWKGLLGGGGSGDTSAAAQKLQADAEVRQQQVEALRLKNEKARGVLIPRDEIIATLTPFFAQLRRSTEALARSIVTEVAPYVDATTARRIGRECDEVMRKFLRQVASGCEYVDSSGSTARTKAKTRSRS